MIDTRPERERFVKGKRRAAVVPSVPRQPPQVTERVGGARRMANPAKDRERLLGPVGGHLDLAEAGGDAAQQHEGDGSLRVRAKLLPEGQSPLQERSRSVPAAPNDLDETEQVDRFSGEELVADLFSD